jgi:hypothetical protein
MVLFSKRLLVHEFIYYNLLNEKWKILVGKPERKRPLGITRCRWEDNIKMDVREIGWDVNDCINLAQDRDQWRTIVNTVMNLRVP